MSSHPQPNENLVPPAMRLRFDELESKFTRSLDGDGKPRIEDFLERVPAEFRAPLLERLLLVECLRRESQGNSPPAVPYLERFSTYREVVERALAAAPTKGNKQQLTSAHAANDELAATLPPSIQPVLSGNTEEASQLSTFRSSPSAEINTADYKPGKKTQRRETSSPEIITQIGDYEILEEIARGGMGVVYKARQKKLNRIVAIKMILAGQFAAEEDILRFYSEAEAVAKLDHPGIVPIYEVDTFEGRHFFSMGFVDGKSLHDRVAQGPLPQAQAAQIVLKVARAVHYAHQHGVVHRDLKPRNILMTSDGEPKVTDFGLAKRVDSGSDLTVSGQILGTPSYMPPEQAEGRIAEVGPTADVYALGAVLYATLTGRPPFQGTNFVETLKQVVDTPPVPPRLLNPAVNRDLETICLKCLEKSAAHRYATAAEVADEIDRYLEGEPIRARRLGPIGRGWRWIKKRPLVAALALAVLVVAAMGGFAVQLGQRAAETRALAAVQRQIESALDDVQLTPEYLGQMDVWLTDLERRDPTAAIDVRRRLHDAFVEEIRRELRRPKLTTDVIARITIAIDLLKPRAGEAAAALLSDLERRRRDWQDIFVLRPPFAEVTQYLNEPQIQVSPEKLLPSSARLPKAGLVLPTRIDSQGIVQWEAIFAEEWEKAGQIGLVIGLGSEGTGGYKFVLSAELPQALVGAVAIGDEGYGAEELATTSPSFELWRERNQPLVATIYRNQQVLARESIAPGKISAGPITMRASRNRGELTWQIGSLTPIRFSDPFPLSNKQSEKFGIVWPPEVPITHLAVRRMERPTAVSPLEQGDDLFEVEDFTAALAAYQQQARETDDSEYRDESLYKQGLCLQRLGRFDEAAAALTTVMSSTGERWPPLAGCQLWVLLLRQKRTSEADGTFDRLSELYDEGQLSAFIPYDVRNEILQAYRSDLNSFGGLLRLNRDIVATTRRIAAIDRLLSADGKGNPETQMAVARSFNLMGDVAAGLEAAEFVGKGTTNPVILRHYSRLLRLTGAPQQALNEVDAFYKRRPDIIRGTNTDAELERARAYAKLEDWNRCEEVLQQLHNYRRYREEPDFTGDVFIAAMRGMLLDRQGARGAAETVWKESYRKAMTKLDPGGGGRTETLILMIMGSLSAEMTEAEAKLFFNIIVQRGKESAFFRQAQALTNPQTASSAIRRMWRSPLGRQHAENIIFETITLQERVKIPVCIAASEYFNQSAYGGNVDLEQQQFLYDGVAMIYDQIFRDGKITMSHVAQMMFTWKGTTNFLGWAGVAPNLDPKLRSMLAYLFGHRFEKLGESAQSQTFLKEALGDGASETGIRLAETDLALAREKQSQVTFHSNFPESVTVVVQQNGKQVEEVPVQATATVRLPVGKTTLRLTASRADLRLSASELDLQPLAHRSVEITWLWQPSENKKTLPGLVSSPSHVAIGNRWQAVAKFSTPASNRMAIRSDGTQLAIAGSDRLVRVYDVTTRELIRIFVDSPAEIRDLAWSPRGNLLAAGDNDKRLRCWDVSTGELVFQRTENAAIPAVAWSGDGQRLAYFAYGQPLRIVDARGSLVREIPVREEGIESLALDASGKILIYRAYESNTKKTWLSIFDVAANKPLETLHSDAFLYHASLSPDGRWLVSGENLSNIQFWSFADRHPVEAYHGENKKLTSFSWSADAHWLLMTSEWSQLLLWDLSGSQPILTKTWRIPDVRQAILSPDAESIYLAKQDSVVLKLTIADESLSAWGTPRLKWASLAQQPRDQRFTIIASNGVVCTVNRNGETEWQKSSAAKLSPNGNAWNASGTHWAGIYRDKTLAVYTAEGKDVPGARTPLNDHAQALAWHPAGQLIAVADGKTVRVVRASDRKVELELPVQPENITAVAWTPDGRLVTADAAGMLRFWDEQRAIVCEFWARNRQSVARFAISPNGKFIATQEADRTVSLWTDQGNPIATLPGTKEFNHSFAWSPNSQALATAGINDAIRLWSPEGKLLKHWQASPGSGAIGIDWQGNDELLTADAAGSIRRWSVQDGSAGESLWTADGEGWIRFSAGGELLDIRGQASESILFGSDAGRSSLNLHTSLQFEELIAAKHPVGHAPALAAPTEKEMPRPFPLTPAENLPAVKADAEELGRLDDERIIESSGLIRHSETDDAFWTINDSDPQRRLFLIGKDGATRGTWQLENLDAGELADWEDLATFRKEKQQYLIVGNIGDNRGRRESISLYLFPEPAVATATTEVERPLNVPHVLKLNFEDGPRDCEAIAVDESRGTLLLVSKELSEDCGLYEIPLDLQAKKPLTARRIARLNAAVVTSMDISPDGRRMAILTGLHVLEYRRNEQETWAAAVARPPLRLEIPQLPQGEAVAYRRDGKSLLLTSEGLHSPLWQVKLPADNSEKK